MLKNFLLMTLAAVTLIGTEGNLNAQKKEQEKKPAAVEKEKEKKSNIRVTSDCKRVTVIDGTSACVFPVSYKDCDGNPQSSSYVPHVQTLETFMVSGGKIYVDCAGGAHAATEVPIDYDSEYLHCTAGLLGIYPIYCGSQNGPLAPRTLKK